jgi:hypothetical protein
VKQIRVKVQSDHLERQISVPKPILALTELVWNALDADATKVRVELSRNKMGGLQSIMVSDNGHGISYADAIPAFEKLGGSWKNSQAKSKGERRLLHGKAGKGRFRAFFLGDEVTWKTCYEDNGSVQQLTIQGTRSRLGVFIDHRLQGSTTSRQQVRIHTHFTRHPQRPPQTGDKRSRSFWNLKSANFLRLGG